MYGICCDRRKMKKILTSLPVKLLIGVILCIVVGLITGALTMMLTGYVERRGIKATETDLKVKL